MKVLLINGSPRPEGNTRRALDEVASVLKSHDIETETIWIGNKPIQGCIACYKCKETGVCIFNNGLYKEIREKLKDTDGIVIGSPTYYAGVPGPLCSLLDRLFFSSGNLLKGKPGASVGVARRAGAVDVVQRLNLYYEISSMPVVTSQYWNLVYGLLPKEVEQDAEGMQTMRTLGHNMAQLLYSLSNVDSRIDIVQEPFARTNFIR